MPNCTIRGGAGLHLGPGRTVKKKKNMLYTLSQKSPQSLDSLQQ